MMIPFGRTETLVYGEGDRSFLISLYQQSSPINFISTITALNGTQNDIGNNVDDN